MADISTTYRLQLHPGFSFAEACRVAGYLKELGARTLYLSPVFSARPGSSHGYDVLDMNHLSDELGGKEGFRQLSDRVKAEGLFLLLDIVPNHCAFHAGNERLMDVLEKGPLSKYYGNFDITWDHPYPNIRGKLLAPFLGDFYARCLERGEIRLTYSQLGFQVCYYDTSLPICLTSYSLILKHNLRHINPSLPQANTSKLFAVIHLLENLSEETNLFPQFNHGVFAKKVLWELYSEDEGIRRHIEDNLEEFNSAKEQPDGSSYRLLDNLLDEQYYRLAYWKVGTEELNYRRFFSINDLICLRIENPVVMEESHRLVAELLKGGIIQGVRVDHVDGLYDPLAYLRALREINPNTKIIVEKILEQDEDLPSCWPIEGTTGYDFLNIASLVLGDNQGVKELEKIYRSFTGIGKSYQEMARSNEHNIVGKHMAGDIDNLALLLKSITNRTRRGKDLTMYALRRALVEILTVFPRYRTYVNSKEFRTEDSHIFTEVISTAVRNAPHFREELRLIGSFIQALFEGALAEPELGDWQHFVMRLQQYTGPLRAKGVEDTTFYQYNRLLSRNEVGCDPTVIGGSIEEFHSFMARRAARWPQTLNTLATHDTKRGEDVRARIAVIAENPQEWAARLFKWQKINRKYRLVVNDREMPSRNDEYFIYQTLLGCAPFEGFGAAGFQERLEKYVIKAAREAKIETSWLNPDQDYEKALLRFIASLLNEKKKHLFAASFWEYAHSIHTWGLFNSLSQTVLKLTCPGIPDIYQGTELWDLSLVDPDNRRPVDFDLRTRLLGQIKEQLLENRSQLISNLLKSPEDGRIKMFVIHELLQLREKFHEVFLQGDYIPLLTSGEKSAHVLAYARNLLQNSIVVAVPRLVSKLQLEQSLCFGASSWGDTTLQLPHSSSPWIELFTLRTFPNTPFIAAGELFCDFPVAVLRKT